MLSRILLLLIICSYSSCALFKIQNLQDRKIEDLISFIKSEGEGKGRLGLDQHQYLFSFDAILKENTDWLLAASIPLHGEEVLMLPNLKAKVVSNVIVESLEVRIERGIGQYLKAQNKSPKLAKLFMKELRNLMRFVQYKKLGLEISCNQHECKMGDIVYQVEATAKQLSIKKALSEEYYIELAALNLTESFFNRSNILLRSKNQSISSPALLSLELFWN